MICFLFGIVFAIVFILLLVAGIVEEADSPLFGTILSIIAILSTVLFSLGFYFKVCKQTYIVIEEPCLIQTDEIIRYSVKVRNNNKEQVLKLNSEQVENFKEGFVVISMEDFKGLYEEVISETKYK